LDFLNYYDLDSGKFALEIKETFSVLLVITRRWQTSKSTISTFNTLPVKPGIAPVEGYMLEPKGPATTAENQNQRIPAGTYRLKWHHTGRFGPYVPLLYNDQVAESRLILIHPGNYPKDTIGCLLPGVNKSQDFVGHSQTKTKELWETMRHHDLNSGKFLINIEENF